MEAVYHPACRKSVEGWNSLPDETRLADIDNAPVPEGGALLEDGSILTAEQARDYWRGAPAAPPASSDEALEQRALLEEVRDLRSEIGQLRMEVRQLLAIIEGVINTVGRL